MMHLADQPATVLLRDVRKEAGRRLRGAVTQNSIFSLDGLSQRLFAQAFRGLVYPQIWEDPEIDMEALGIRPGDRMVAIASGGCNTLSYLTADPASIELVDLNAAHVAFNRLKIAALKWLPDYAAFRRFYADANSTANLAAYREHIRPHLDAETRAYWEGRTITGKRRISMFSRNLYRFGLLGLFIGMAHRAAKFYGVDPAALLDARSMQEQRAFFDEKLSPLFDKRLIRWATSCKSSLFGLGIPPQQYDALAGGGDMAVVLRRRLEKLACGFPLGDNYFAWQAFGRRYSSAEDGPLPPYLAAGNYETVRDRADRLSIVNASFTELLRSKPGASVDCFVLLDAQDWMNDEQLDQLWRAITRTAAPGARVIFRTAAGESVLPGRLESKLLANWLYRDEESGALHARDRSSIYGGFHLYVLKDI
jgi:S-adenosylmethionine-diacylglycerol 3-amino-3-carboxypropyl transferase